MENHHNILLHPVGYMRGLDATNHIIIGSDISVGDALGFFESYRGSGRHADNRWNIAWKHLALCDMRLPVYIRNHHVNWDMFRAGFVPVHNVDRHVSFWDPVEAMALCLLGRSRAQHAASMFRSGQSPLNEHGKLWMPIPAKQRHNLLSVKLLDVVGAHRAYPFAPIIRVGTSGVTLDGKPTRAWLRPDGRAYAIGGFRGRYVLDSVPLFDVYSSYGFKVFPDDMIDLIPDY